MTNGIKAFINGEQFPCGSKSDGTKLAYPNLKNALSAFIGKYAQLCDYVTNGYNNFKGVITSHCGSASLDNKTKIKPAVLAKVKGKGKGQDC